VSDLILQGTDEWLAARRGNVTGSRIKDVLANGRGGGESLTRKKYIYQIALERVTGITPDSYKSDAMERGNILEPDAVAVYEWQTGNVSDEVGFVYHPTIDRYGASPDRLIGDDGVIEVKSVMPHTHIDWMKAGVVPSEHKKQMQSEMDVTGRKWCDFVSYCPELPIEIQLFVVRLDRDEDFIKEMHEKIAIFLKEVDDMVDWIKKRISAS